MRFSLIALAATAVIMTGCTRIETGEVGVRTDMNKQIVKGELLPGSWNQTMFGEVNTFPVRDLAIHLKLQPQAGDNSTLKEFEITIIYNIVADSVSELWSSKSRSFHIKDESGDINLMYHYIENIAANAAGKAVRKFPSLKVNDNRGPIEKDVKDIMTEAFKAEGLATSINVSQVQVNRAVPADEIVASANNAVRAQNDYNTKVIEVQTADQEAQRIAKLNSNAKAIEYMQAQAQMTIADAVKAGKVSAIIIPFDFKGVVNVGTLGQK